MRLKTRIKMICFSMAALIVVLSAIVIFISIRSSLRTNASTNVQAVGKQTILVLDNMVGVMDDISLSPILEPEIYKILLKDYQLEADRYQYYQDQKTVANKLYTDVYYRNDKIYGITYISALSDMVCYTNKWGYSPNLSALEQQEWYCYLRNSGQDFAIFSLETDDMYPRGGALFCFARILRDAYTGREIGIMRIDARLQDLDGLWEGARLCPDAELMMQNRDGRLIYASGDVPTIDGAGEPEVEFLGGRQYLTVTEYSDVYGYAFTSLTPMDFVYSGLNNVLLTILLISGACIIAAFWLSEVLSDHIMEPIRDLLRCMKAVCGGNLTIRAKLNVGGEFGEVCHSFNLMVDHIQQLITRIYEEEQKKRRAEFLALQAQISPHFLLNTLNTIRWMAVLQGNKAIASTLEDLSKMLSFTIRDTREKLSIDTELMQIQSYLNILAVRYPNRFTVTFDVEDSVRSCLTLKFLLQPFLENSILHGLDGLDREGVVHVKICREGDNIHYVIEDNGKRIEPERIPELLTRTASGSGDTNHIGISNVVERIKMVYGPDYGVEIQSVVGEGTRVSIQIPAQCEEETEAVK